MSEILYHYQSKKYRKQTSRWYVRNYFTIMCQGGDYWKKVFYFRSFHCVQNMFSKCSAHVPLLQGHGSMYGENNESEGFGCKQILQPAKACKNCKCVWVDFLQDLKVFVQLEAKMFGFCISWVVLLILHEM